MYYEISLLEVHVHSPFRSVSHVHVCRREGMQTMLVLGQEGTVSAELEASGAKPRAFLKNFSPSSLPVADHCQAQLGHSFGGTGK
jgi:hypothetical protein